MLQPPQQFPLIGQACGRAVETHAELGRDGDLGRMHHRKREEKKLQKREKRKSGSLREFNDNIDIDDDDLFQTFVYGVNTRKKTRLEDEFEDSSDKAGDSAFDETSSEKSSCKKDSKKSSSNVENNSASKGRNIREYPNAHKFMKNEEDPFKNIKAENQEESVGSGEDNQRYPGKTLYIANTTGNKKYLSNEDAGLLVIEQTILLLSKISRIPDLQVVDLIQLLKAAIPQFGNISEDGVLEIYNDNNSNVDCKNYYVSGNEKLHNNIEVAFRMLVEKVKKMEEEQLKILKKFPVNHDILVFLRHAGLIDDGELPYSEKYDSNEMVNSPQEIEQPDKKVCLEFKTRQLTEKEIYLIEGMAKEHPEFTKEQIEQKIRAISDKETEIKVRQVQEQIQPQKTELSPDINIVKEEIIAPEEVIVKEEVLENKHKDTDSKKIDSATNDAPTVADPDDKWFDIDNDPENGSKEAKYTK